MARATGIRRRHSSGCRSRDGGRCDCNAGWEAWVYLAREDKSGRQRSGEAAGSPGCGPFGYEGPSIRANFRVGSRLTSSTRPRDDRAQPASVLIGARGDATHDPVHDVPLGVAFRRHRDEKIAVLKLADSDH